MPELDRRDFLKLVGVGAGAAATACADPVEKLVPYVIQPEGVTPGIASYYASTCTECPAGCGIVVKTREGRPIKLEGNPENPINRGSLCTRGQVTLGRTYHPDRIEGPLSLGGDGTQSPITWEEGMSRLTSSLQKASGRAYVLGGPVGPSLSGVIDGMADAAGAKRVVYEPFSYDALRSGTEAVFGVRSLPIFDPEKADLIVDMGSDFLATGMSPCENSRQYADARDIQKHPEGGTRMISISPRLDGTTQSSDEWIAAGPGSQGAIAFALARAVYDKKGVPEGIDTSVVEAFLSGPTLEEAAAQANVEPERLKAIADALLAAKNPLVMPPGVAGTDSSAVSTVAVVMLINAMTGAIGQSVQVPAPSDQGAPASFAELEAMVSEMKAGRVDVLLVHDSNPVYSMPDSLGFNEALARVGTVVSFATLKDETSKSAQLVLPSNANMETWGDAAPRPGVRGLVQPTIRPLLDTQALGDIALDVTRALGGSAPEGSFHKVVEANWSDVNWRDALGNGGVYTDVEIPVPPMALSLNGLGYSAPQMAGDGDYKLIAFPHPYLGDGSGAALPWLQEIPEPVTKLEWNSWVELSFATAEKFGVDFGDVVEIQTPSGSVEASVFPRGGIRDDTIAIPTGQGHTVGFYSSMEGEGERPSWLTVESAVGTPGVARGVNVMSILPATTDERGGRTFLNTRASVKKTGRFRRLALAQWTDNQRKRHLAQSVTVPEANGHGEKDHGGHGGGHHDEPPHTFTASFDADPKSPYRWGMAIDNDKCDGCSACVAACYIENNIPVVGEGQAIQHREMSWIRIERYIGEGHVGGGEERRPIPRLEELGKLDVRYIAMPCQQCGAAPCESVCPTLATYHNKEGLNGMIYNRCAGTRYCANNCSYKVRRFNYFDYGNENFPGMLGLMLNPDVTVRQQGVMEKCSFCVQRIQAARQPAKDEGRDIMDGEVQTACQQACPTNSISFGNLRDDGSKVVKEADQPNRSYHLLQELNLRSSITYLAKVNREDQEGSA